MEGGAGVTDLDIRMWCLTFNMGAPHPARTDWPTGAARARHVIAPQPTAHHQRVSPSLRHGG
jgi:hypothetical protein